MPWQHSTTPDNLTLDVPTQSLSPRLCIYILLFFVILTDSVLFPQGLEMTRAEQTRQGNRPGDGILEPSPRDP